MTLTQLLLKEMEQEAQTTRKMLSLIPADKLDWQPHLKSMKMRDLSVHIAELPSWIPMFLNTSGLDFAESEYIPKQFTTIEELINCFETCLIEGRNALVEANEDTFDEIWTLRTGDKIHSTYTKVEGIRHAFCQIVHHRAQLGVYLRLLDIPIPGSYGPSADDTGSF